jgi:ribosomal protein S17
MRDLKEGILALCHTVNLKVQQTVKIKLYQKVIFKSKVFTATAGYNLYTIAI